MHDVANRLEHDAIGKASPNSFWYFAARKQSQSETIGIIIWSFFNLDLIRNRWDKFENLLKKRISVHFSYLQYLKFVLYAYIIFYNSDKNCLVFEIFCEVLNHIIFVMGGGGGLTIDFSDLTTG